MSMLLDRSHDLPGPRRVRLRLAHGSDRAGLHALLTRLGLAAEDLDVRRALRCAPGDRLVVCATRWNGSAECFAGVGSLDVRSGRVTVVGEDREVSGLLVEALDDHASAWGRRVA